MAIQGRWLCGLCIAAALVLMGCQSKSGPFEDVAAKSQQEPTAIAEADQAPVQPAGTGATAAAQTPAASVAPAAVEAKASVAPPTVPVTPAATVAAAGSETDVKLAPALPRPAEVDRIGARRDWPRSAAMRPSGKVATWPLYYPDASTKDRNDAVAMFVEPGEFLVNTVLVPVRMFITAPWTKVTYSEVDDEGWQPAEQRVVIEKP